MTKQETIQQLAREHLRIETLEARKSDRLDFHDVAVWSIEKALDAAFSAGADKLLAAAEALLAAKDNQMETRVEWDALRRAVANARPGGNTIPNTTFVIGQRVHCEPLGEDGHIVGFEDDGFILIIDLVQGGTEHVPAGDCSAR
jgi:YD repeat-containing protein